MDFRLNLNSETVQQVYSADPLCIELGASIRDVMRLLRERNRGCALICREGKLAGIFTERDALKLMASQANLDRPIDEVMMADPVTITLTESVADAITKMSQGGYRRLPVVDDAGVPLGVMKVSGILHYFVEHFRNVVYTLPPQPHHAMQEREGA